MVAQYKQSHIQFLQDIFADLDKRVITHGGQSIISGFWQSSSPIRLSPDHSESAIRLRNNGFWRATSNTVYGKVELLAAVLGSNVRVGILIPRTFSDSHVELTKEISCLYNGSPANAERDIGAMHLVDWFFKDDPFSSEWLARCSVDEVAVDIFKNHFLWLVIHLWEGFARAIAVSYGNTVPVFAREYVSSDMAEQCGLTIIDRFEYQSDHGMRKVTLVNTDSGKLPESVIEMLQKILPDFSLSAQQ